MNKLDMKNNYLVTTPTLIALTLAGSTLNVESAKADDLKINTTIQQIQSYGNNANPMGQVTSVGQLRDVSPTDWAYEALRSLVERYGCIVGYPDRTYRGNRALSRYEFAAGLNACMQQMERLIASSESVLKEDLDTLKRLIKEFEDELAMLGARVDNLEARVAFLEDHQFSTTTKLTGEVLIAVEGATGPDDKLDQFYEPLDDVPGTSLTPSDFETLDDQYTEDLSMLDDALSAGNITQEEYDQAVDQLNTAYAGQIEDSYDDPDSTADQVTLSNRVRLTFDTSFTGTDKLRVRLAAGNVLNLGDVFGTDQARLNFEQDTDNDLVIDRAYYKTPLFGEFATFWIGTALPLQDVYNTFSPYTESDGTGSLARATRFNPLIYRQPSGAGIGLKVGSGDWFDITASYLSGNANVTTEGGGLFDGTYSAGVQLGVYPFENMGLGIAYMHSYFNGARDGVDVPSRANLTGSVGSNYTSGVSNSIALLGGDGGFRGTSDPFSGAATSADSVGVQGSWTLGGFVNLSAWGGWSTATAHSYDSTGTDRRDDWTELWTWNTNISLLDLFAEGAVLTVGGGQLPRAGYVEGTFGRDVDQSWIVEGNYKFPVNDNISITPGAYAVFNPNGNSDNDTIIVGVLRTVFKF